MPKASAPLGGSRAVDARLNEVVRKGKSLEAEGIPFDTGAFLAEVREQLARRDLEAALTTLGKSEAIVEKALRDWEWLKGLLSRVDSLRDLAAKSGVDLDAVDQRIGNARDQLRSVRLQDGALEKAAASASLALVVLNDTLPKFFAQEAQQLARSIREARERGEDVREAGQELARLLKALREGRLEVTALRFIDLRRAVTRIPPAPAVPPQMQQREEEEILLEARNLARRLNRMKFRARDAQGAARLMAQVRAALSEDRRFGTPEEELEELWGEVDRLARERMGALAEPPGIGDPPTPEERDLEPPDDGSSEAPVAFPKPAIRRGPPP